MFKRYDAVSALWRTSLLRANASRSMSWLFYILAAALLQLGLSTTGSVAEENTTTAIEDFISTYDCMLVENLKTISEHGDRGSSRDRFFVVDFQEPSQRFVQCLFFEFATKLLCEASSGRYGPAPSEEGALVLSQEDEAALKSLGFEAPYQVANFRQEIALGHPPNFREVAALVLRTMYVVYGARIDTPMSITAPMAGHEHAPLLSCLPLS